MSMRISVAAGAFSWYPLNRALRLVSTAGADGVELMASRRLLRAGVDCVDQIATDAGVAVLSVHSLLRLRPATL
jgi:sugar phosphate isomerase/epimerase